MLKPSLTNTENRHGIRNNFFRAVGGLINSHRLGDMLLVSRLITADELRQALDLQKATREPLGKILVRQGVVSATQVYRKLAEQWCLKITAAGLTMVMQTLSPSSASAEDKDEPVRIAAAFAPAASKPLASDSSSYSGLFGATEVKSDDISAFTKWTSVSVRFESQMDAQSSSPRIQEWKSHLQSLQGRSVLEQIEGVNKYVNTVKYIEDKDNYHKSDYWGTPVEFFKKGGDCEDFAIAKYASLRALGLAPSQLRIAIVQDEIKNISHAILIVHAEGDTFILDNQDKRVRSMSEVTRYKPIFSINSAHWWRYKA